MLLHTYKYALKSSIREKSLIFWTFLFPILLGTLFFVTFGNAYASSEAFSKIPVAVVQTEGNHEIFFNVLDNLKTEEGTNLLKATYTNADKAKQLLSDGQVNGIIFAGKDITLTVKGNGVYQTVLKVFLEQYKQSESIIYDIVSTNPTKLNSALSVLNSDVQYYSQTNTTSGNMDVYVQYFYALIAMSCLYASFLGIDRTIKLQANLSDLGQRRGVAPTNKMTVIASEFLANLTIQFLIECIILFYLTVILGIDFGNNVPQILLIIFFGSAFGVAFGVFIGSLPRLSAGVKTGIGTGLSMLFSFCSGLMFSGMKQLIEHICPLFNKINPAALIVDAFYALNIYDTYERYTLNIVILGSMTVILCLISVIMTRRTRYASL